MSELSFRSSDRRSRRDTQSNASASPGAFLERSAYCGEGSMADGEPPSRETASTLLRLPFGNSGAVRATESPSGPGRLHEVHGLSQRARDQQSSDASQDGMGRMHRL